MQREDWLERQVAELGRAIAAALGGGRAEVDAELEGLVGARLDVLRALPPAMVVRWVGERYGSFSPERVFSAMKLLEVELAARPDAALALRRRALADALVAAVGAEGIARMEAELGRVR